MMQLAATDVREGACTVAPVRVGLLGGFRVERDGFAVPDFAWQRRSAKQLTKLLATIPSHALHRERLLEILWPNADLDSGRNSLAKALHAARRALEPERPAREDSSYLRVRDEMITLRTDHVLIDADDFQRLAQDALRLATASAYERALAAYTGELLPEDLYEDWPSERRRYFADLNVRLLLGLAETLVRKGAHLEAVERLRSALQEDPTREDVHRQIMRVYGAMGARGLAFRQFEICRAVLHQELEVAPDWETLALYQDLLANHVQPFTTRPERTTSWTGVDGTLTLECTPSTPFVGREQVLRSLGDCLTQADVGHGGFAVVTGEAGVGKTRLVAEFVRDARQRGACVLGDDGHASSFPYGPFTTALESYAAGRPEAERTDLARRYPALDRIVPSFETATSPSIIADDRDRAQVHLGTEIARLLTEVAEAHTVVVILGDLDQAHASNLELLKYLATLARQRRWLMIGTLSDETSVPESDPWRMLASMTYERVCARVEVQPLQPEECYQLARALLRGHVVSSEFLDRLYSVTLGNPFLIEQLARDEADRDTLRAPVRRLTGRAPESSPVPDAVRALVARSLAPLGPNVRRLLELAATSGTEVSLDELRRAGAELRPPLADVELFDALDRALSTRILVEGRDGYAIRHTLVRATLLDELPRHRRAQFDAASGRSTVDVRLAATGTHDSVRSWSPQSDLG